MLTDITFIYIGGRRSWRVGAVCKTVVIALSGSESHPSDQSNTEELFNSGSIVVMRLCA